MIMQLVKREIASIRTTRRSRRGKFTNAINMRPANLTERAWARQNKVRPLIDANTRVPSRVSVKWLEPA